MQQQKVQVDIYQLAAIDLPLSSTERSSPAAQSGTEVVKQWGQTLPPPPVSVSRST